MRNAFWYRRRAGWVGIVTVHSGGFQIVLKRVAATFDDALADANELLEIHDDHLR